MEGGIENKVKREERGERERQDVSGGEETSPSQGNSQTVQVCPPHSPPFILKLVSPPNPIKSGSKGHPDPAQVLFGLGK